METEYVRQKNRVRSCKDDILKAAGRGLLIEEYYDEILKAVGLESLIEENREFENMDG